MIIINYIMAYDDVDKSEFNIGLSTGIFIRFLLNTFSMHLNKRELHDCFNVLSILVLEVDYLFDKKEESENKEIRNDLIEMDNNYVKHRKDKKIENIESYGNFYEKLVEYQRFIRKALHRRDMLIRTKDDPTKAMGKTY